MGRQNAIVPGKAIDSRRFSNNSIDSVNPLQRKNAYEFNVLNYDFPAVMPVVWRRSQGCFLSAGLGRILFRYSLAEFFNAYSLPEKRLTARLHSATSRGAAEDCGKAIKTGRDGEDDIATRAFSGISAALAASVSSFPLAAPA
jgi:hypothetical protein